MKILEDKDKTNIVLSDGDALNIQTLKGNPIHIEIKCEDGCLLVDEIAVKRLKEIKTEQEQVEILRKNREEK